MNWDNKDKDPWGGNNDAPDFDELMKKFSSILGGKKSSSNGSGGSGKGSGFNVTPSRNEDHNLQYFLVLDVLEKHLISLMYLVFTHYMDVF